MARKSEQTGLWVVERHEAQHMAWRGWLLREGFWKAKTLHLAKMTVPLEWPPETWAAAAAISDHFREVRAAASKDKGCPEMLPVPVAPEPWVRWSLAECARRVQEFRELSDDSPMSKEEAIALCERVYARLGMPKGMRSKPEAQSSVQQPKQALAIPAGREDVRNYDLAKLAEEKASDRFPTRMAAE